MVLKRLLMKKTKRRTMKKQKGEGIGEIRKDLEHNNNQLGAKDGAGRGPGRLRWS